MIQIHYDNGEQQAKRFSFTCPRDMEITGIIIAPHTVLSVANDLISEVFVSNQFYCDMDIAPNKRIMPLRKTFKKGDVFTGLIKEFVGLPIAIHKFVILVEKGDLQ